MPAAPGCVAAKNASSRTSGATTSFSGNVAPPRPKNHSCGSSRPRSSLTRGSSWNAGTGGSTPVACCATARVHSPADTSRMYGCSGVPSWYGSSIRPS